MCPVSAEFSPQADVFTTENDMLLNGQMEINVKNMLLPGKEKATRTH